MGVAAGIIGSRLALRGVLDEMESISRRLSQMATSLDNAQDRLKRMRRRMVKK